YDLSGPGAPKNTRHYEIDLSGGSLEYTPGDSLAVQPTNDPVLVDDTLKVLGFTGEEVVTHPKNAALQVPIRQALTEGSLLTEVDNKLIKAIIEKTNGQTLLADMNTPETKQA